MFSNQNKELAQESIQLELIDTQDLPWSYHLKELAHDFLILFASLLYSTGGGALIGSVIGSFIPGVGTVLGAIIGTFFGAGFGLTVTGIYGMFNHRLFGGIHLSFETLAGSCIATLGLSTFLITLGTLICPVIGTFIGLSTGLILGGLISIPAYTRLTQLEQLPQLKNLYASSTFTCEESFRLENDSYSEKDFVSSKPVNIHKYNRIGDSDVGTPENCSHSYGLSI